MITAFICIVIFVWLAVCAAKMIAKEFVCKDCILKRKCDEHRKETGKTFAITTNSTITLTTIFISH